MFTIHCSKIVTHTKRYRARFYDQEEVYNDLKIDIKSIIAQNQSDSIRPKNIKKSSEYNNIASYTNEISKANSWIRLAHYEFELVQQEHYKLKEYKIFGGVTFQIENKPVFPYSGYRLNMNDIWTKMSSDYEIEDTIIFSFIQKNHQLEDFKLLWLNPTIVSFLGLEICDFLEGLFAVNQKNEVVLKFNSWYSDYAASDYGDDISHEIPKLDGSELVIREDYYCKICEMFNVPPKYSIFRTF